ncbi:ATP-dependent DNA helicase [Pirellulaceae bacterium SH449]
MIEQISREDWLARHPHVKKWIESHPADWKHIPAFSAWPDVDSIPDITEHQREMLSRATVARMGILGGSPGTGKSYTVAKLIKAMIDQGIVGAHDICIGAPTGKAAVRVTELMERSGLSLRARTWHSILGISANSETGGWQFTYGRECKLPYRVLIGDESSMIDLSLMLAIMRARDVGTHFLLVGDVNQLPPVGAGAPLRDMIRARLPYGELTEIKRNSGGIVEACAAIRDKKPWYQFTTARDTNLRMHEVGQPELQIAKTIELIRKHQADGADPIWDCQVLVAVNEKSPLARSEINKVLQDELNQQPARVGTLFRERDKIVCLKNGFYRSTYSEQSEDLRKNDRGEVYVANGELASVQSIDAGQITVELQAPYRIVVIPFKAEQNESGESGSLGNWDLAYALSVHKSQGSEFPHAIVLIDDYPGAKQICDRSWIYTAISRAKDTCHLVGKFETAMRFCWEMKIDKRKTFLTERIGLLNAEKVEI